MFGWVKKLTAPPPPDARKLLDAQARGRELGDQMHKALDAYLGVRGRQIREDFLPILQQRLPVLLGRETRTPERVAQAEWLTYVGELEGVQEVLRKEVPSKMSDLFASADLVGVRPELDEYLTQEIEATVRRAGGEAALVIVRELEAIRSAHGLPLLNLPSEGDVGELKGLQTAYVMVRQLRSGIRQLVSTHLEERMIPLQERYLDAFRQRLRTIHDSPPYPAPEVAEVERKIFLDNIDKIPAELWEDFHSDLDESFVLADLGGFRAMLDEMIEARIKQLMKTLRTEGDSMFAAAVASAGSALH